MAGFNTIHVTNSTFENINVKGMPAGTILPFQSLPAAIDFQFHDSNKSLTNVTLENVVFQKTKTVQGGSS